MSEDTSPYDEYVQQNPSTIVRPLEEKRQDVLKAFEEIKKTDADIALVVTHRMSLTTLLWDLVKGGKSKINSENFRELFGIAPLIAHTSITRFVVNKDGGLVLKELATRSHLGGKSELLTGVHLKGIK